MREIGQENREFHRIVETRIRSRGDRLQVAKDAMDLGAGGIDLGDDDGDAGAGVFSEAGTQPMSAGSEFGVFVGSVGEGAAGGERWLIEFGDNATVGSNGGEQTSSLQFRLEQLEAADDTGQELVLRFEEKDGITKLATLTATGLDVELFHILTFT